jgi:hypothetical protein
LPSSTTTRVSSRWLASIIIRLVIRISGRRCHARIWSRNHELAATNQRGRRSRCWVRVRNYQFQRPCRRKSGEWQSCANHRKSLSGRLAPRPSGCRITTGSWPSRAGAAYSPVPNSIRKADTEFVQPCRPDSFLCAKSLRGKCLIFDSPRDEKLLTACKQVWRAGEV